MEIGTKTIETERLILRRFKISDAKNMFSNWTQNSKVTEFLNWSPHKNIKETRKKIIKWNMSYHKKNFYTWAIELKELGEVIGAISAAQGHIYRHNDKKTIIEKEIGYCLGQNWWQKGIMTEALIAVIGYLFDNTDTTRITAKHSSENPASGRVMQKAGMTYEGTLRECHTSNHGIDDLRIYSILKKDVIKK